MRLMLLVGLGLTLVGCSFEEAPVPSASGSAVPSVRPALPAATSAALITGLSTISPALVADQEAAVRNSQEICDDVAMQKPAAEILNNARVRFVQGTAPNLTVLQGQAILSTVRANLCPGAPSAAPTS